MSKCFNVRDEQKSQKKNKLRMEKKALTKETTYIKRTRTMAWTEFHCENYF